MWGRVEVCTWVFMGKLEGRRPLGRRRHRWDDIKMIFRKWGGGAWTGLIWFRIGTDGLF
jgi:hypothetical protein